MDQPQQPSEQQPQGNTPNQPLPKWCPLDAVSRRVLGVLVEKAKTTPSAYPMTLNSLVNACNQKSNRAPVMHVDDESVEESLYSLRRQGAIAEMLGGGRVPKYRHYMYEWMGVDRVEVAVMAELLLRGAQTEGELRTRVSRMEKIDDLDALRVVLARLKERGLVIPLTPDGRGHVITHTLYQDREMEKVRSQYSAVMASSPHATPSSGALSDADPDTDHPTNPPSNATSPASHSSASHSGIMTVEIDELRSQVAQMRSDIDDLTSALEQTRSELERLKSDLGV